MRETYAVQVIRGGSAADITNVSGGSTVFDKPVDNIGNKTIPDYPGYAAQLVINVGEIFDLINIPPEVITGMENARKSDLENKNISTIALEVPIACLNQPASVAPAEMMRLNTSFAPVPKGSQNRLGVLGMDLAGFPNGRRPGDDVVDIELRVAMGILCTLNQPALFGCIPADAPSGSISFTDGAFTSDARFDATFPYLTTPIPGSPQQP